MRSVTLRNLEKAAEEYNPENDMPQGCPMVSYTEMVLIEAVQELIKEVDGLKAQLAQRADSDPALAEYEQARGEKY